MILGLYLRERGDGSFTPHSDECFFIIVWVREETHSPTEMDEFRSEIGRRDSLLEETNKQRKIFRIVVFWRLKNT